MWGTGDGQRALRRGVVLQVQRVREAAGHGRPGQAAQGVGRQGRLPHVPGITHYYTPILSFIHTIFTFIYTSLLML